jgi:hypothetical protein
MGQPERARNTGTGSDRAELRPNHVHGRLGSNSSCLIIGRLKSLDTALIGTYPRMALGRAMSICAIVARAKEGKEE